MKRRAASYGAAHYPRSEQALEEAADASGALPGGGDQHTRRATLWGHGEAGDQAGIRVGLGQDATWLGFGDLHPVLAAPPARGHFEARPARGHFEARDRPGAHATGLDLKVRERRRQEARMMLAHVSEVAVDRLGGRVHPPFGRDMDGSHGICFITVSYTHLRAHETR